MRESAQEQAARLGITWPGSKSEPKRTRKVKPVEHVGLPSLTENETIALTDRVDVAAHPFYMLAIIWMTDPVGTERILPRKL